MTRFPFFLVSLSPWPMSTAISSLFMAIGLTNLFHYNSVYMLMVGAMTMLLSIIQWWRDMIREATFMGKHTSHVQKSFRLGMMLFIISETCSFLAFFWAFFYSSLAPVPELGCTWPPVGITTIDPLSVPLLNTAVLLASAFTVTWTHHALLSKKSNYIYT